MLAPYGIRSKMKVTHEGTTVEELRAVQVSGPSEVRFYVGRVLNNSEIADIEQQIITKGIRLLSPVIQEGRIISIRFQK